MSIPNDRTTFIDYCKRALGWPVIELELDEDQISDRVDYSIRKWQEYHFDGVQRFYLNHQIQQSDIDNKAIPINDPLIIGVIRAFPISQSTINMFDVRYQVRLNDFYNFNNVSMVHYYMTMNHLALLDFLFNMVPTIRFNRKDRNIYLDVDKSDLQIGQFVVFECWRAIDANTVSSVWSDMWLQEYTIEQLKRQWGSNLKKFGKIVMLGGGELNGQQIYDEAVQNIRRLEDEVIKNYAEPCDFFVGGFIPFIFGSLTIFNNLYCFFHRLIT